MEAAQRRLDRKVTKEVANKDRKVESDQKVAEAPAKPNRDKGSVVLCWVAKSGPGVARVLCSAEAKSGKVLRRVCCAWCCAVCCPECGGKVWQRVWHCSGCCVAAACCPRCFPKSGKVGCWEATGLLLGIT